jgi:hypothetical protein
MACPECDGTGEIVLLTSKVKCKCREAAEASLAADGQAVPASLSPNYFSCFELPAATEIKAGDAVGINPQGEVTKLVPEAEQKSFAVDWRKYLCEPDAVGVESIAAVARAAGTECARNTDEMLMKKLIAANNVGCCFEISQVANFGGSVTITDFDETPLKSAEQIHADRWQRLIALPKTILDYNFDATYRAINGFIYFDKKHAWGSGDAFRAAKAIAIVNCPEGKVVGSWKLEESTANSGVLKFSATYDG